MPRNSHAPPSIHFSIEALDDGVFAAVHRKGGWAICNAGIVDLGDACLVFDTFLTVQAAADLREAAERLTGKPVRYVVNSHYHNDHIWGNQVFKPDALIISSEKTRQQIQSEGKEEYEWYSANSEKRLAELKAQLKDQKAEQDTQSAALWVEYFQGLVESMPMLSVHLPELTFDAHLAIRGPDLEISLLTFNGAHTGSDTILWLPSRGIVFMADLLFVQCHPYLPDGNAGELLSALDAIAQMEPRVLVPGHGFVGGMDDVIAMKQYIVHCEELAKGLLGRGMTVEERPSVTVPEEYSSWEHANFYEANVLYFMSKHAAEA